MFIKRAFTVFWFLSLAGTGLTFGQPLPSRPVTDLPIQSIYGELGGSAGSYSLSYDVMFTNGRGIRLGGTYLPEEIREEYYNSKSSYFGTTLLAISIMGQQYLGKGPHKLETGLGIMFGESHPDEVSIPIPDLPAIPFTIGYRYLPKDPGKITGKVALTPVLYNGQVHFRVGFSFGIVIGPNQ